MPYNIILLMKTFITGNRKRATRKALKGAMTPADAALRSPSTHHAFKKIGYGILNPINEIDIIESYIVHTCCLDSFRKKKRSNFISMYFNRYI